VKAGFDDRHGGTRVQDVGLLNPGSDDAVAAHALDSLASVASQLCRTFALSCPSACDPFSRTVLRSMRTGQAAIL
jgi:hypothetical protein